MQHKERQHTLGLVVLATPVASCGQVDRAAIVTGLKGSFHGTYLAFDIERKTASVTSRWEAGNDTGRCFAASDVNDLLYARGKVLLRVVLLRAGSAFRRGTNKYMVM